MQARPGPIDEPSLPVLRGSSWIGLNVADFGGVPVPQRPGLRPVVALQLPAFGDAEWFDAGRPTADRLLAGIDPDALAVLRRGDASLLLDMSGEGQPFLEPWYALLHDALGRAGIAPSACTLLQQNRVLEAPYRRWCAERRIAPLGIGVYDYFPRRLCGLLAREAEPEAIGRHDRGKLFCCFNYKPSRHRTGLVSWMIANGHDRDGHISFAGTSSLKWHEELSIYHWFPFIRRIQPGLDALRERGPMRLDLTGDEGVPEFSLGDPAYYEDSYFTVVTESEPSTGDVVRITEKSLKPLAMSHPALIYGNPGSLRILRGYGFRTFPDFFDESYDEIEEPIARTMAVMAEIARLAAMPRAEVKARYLALEATLRWNRHVARRLLDARFRDKIEPALVEEMARS